ncbi:MAG TPA: DUF5658 family protein [Phycisphaerae bacterium]
MECTPLTPLGLELAHDRRSPGRRALHWFASARSHRVMCAVAGLCLISGFDLALTILAHAQGLLQEINPIAARILPHGPAALLAYKLSLLMVGSAILIRYRRLVICELAAFSLLAVYVLLAFQWKLCYDMYAITVNQSGGLDLADGALGAAAVPLF